MFFTHVCRIVAVLALIGGALQIIMGFTIVSGTFGPAQEALHRYSGAATTGAMIDRGIYAFMFAVALGTLAEIGFSVRRLNKDT